MRWCVGVNRKLCVVSWSRYYIQRSCGEIPLRGGFARGTSPVRAERWDRSDGWDRLDKADEMEILCASGEGIAHRGHPLCERKMDILCASGAREWK